MSKASGGTRASGPSASVNTTYIIGGTQRSASDVDNFIKSYNASVQALRDAVNEKELTDGSTNSKEAFKDIEYSSEYILEKLPQVTIDKMATKDDMLQISHKLSNMVGNFGGVKVSALEEASDIMHSRKRTDTKLHIRNVALRRAEMAEKLQRMAHEIHGNFNKFMRGK